MKEQRGQRLIIFKKLLLLLSKRDEGSSCPNHENLFFYEETPASGLSSGTADREFY